MKRLLATGIAVLTFGSMALPALAEDGSSSSSAKSAKAELKTEIQLLKQKYKVEASAEARVKKEERKVDAVCMQNAVVTRDTAIIAAVNVQSTSWVKALEVRRDALKAAWAMTDAAARKTAIRDAWMHYRNTRKEIREKFRGDRKAAWTQFKTEARACNGSDAGTQDDDNA